MYGQWFGIAGFTLFYCIKRGIPLPRLLKLNKSYLFSFPFKGQLLFKLLVPCGREEYKAGFEPAGCVHCFHRFE